MNTISKRTIAVALMAVLLLGLSTCKKENIEIIARPTVKLFHEATITDYTKASVTAEVIDEGGAAVTERGVVYGLLDGDTIAIPCGSGKGVYLQDLSNLQPSTTYVYWAYAINAGGYGTSPKFNFTTKDNLKPIVMTGEQVSVTTTTAVIGGNKVTNDGGDHVTERGVCYSTDSIQLTVSGVRVPAGEDIGEFSCRLEDLTPNTTYYYCAYAKNSKGPGYGEPKSFTTEALPTYTIEVSANPSNGGTATGGGTFDEGQRCTVVATPNTGYNFVNWTDENNVQAYDSVRYTFEVRENRNLVAHFTSQAYTIRATVEPEGSGTIEGVGGYNYGELCMLVATPKPGYAFEEWTENGSHIDASANYPFTVTGNRNLVAHFRVAEFNLAVSANPMIIPQGDNSQLNAEASGGNGSFTYSWSPASSLNNATIQNPTASPMATTTYTCTATSAAGSTESDSCTVTVVCPPTDLTATVQNTNQVRLSWTAPSTVTSYRIYRNNTLIKSDYTSTTYTDSNLGAGTYSYQVTAVYQNVESPKSNEASATVYGSLSVTATASPNTIPNGSSSTLTATATGGNGSYTYSWTPTTGLSNSHVQSPTASPSTTTTYEVTVSSNGQNATANVTVNVVRAPTNLTANVQNTNQVRLTWTAPNTVTSYKVYRNNTLIKSGLTTTTYTDSNLGSGTYSYQVTAVYNNVESPKSNTASATVNIPLSVTATASPNTIPNGSSSTLTATSTGGNGSYTYSWTPTTGLSNTHVQSPTASPSTTTTYTVTVSSNGQSATANVTVNVVRAPTNLTANVQNTNQVRLTWTAPNTVTSYKVYRNNTLIKSGLTTTTYTDSNLGAGTYSYQVTAVYQNVESPKSNEASAIVYGSLSVTATASPNTIPYGNSSTLTATATGGNGSYTYSWTPTTGLSNSHVQSPTASPSTTTTYTVTVSNNGQNATASVTVNVVRAPTNLQYTVNGSNVNLTWTAPNTVSYYKVYRNGSPISGNIYQTGYSDYNLNPGTYNYYVTAIYNNVSSPQSNTVQVIIAPQAPTGAIGGVFSVSASQRVYFSQGNLQYKASNGTWRFATNQYDYIGSTNSNISSSYSGWIDLFGWGTSGWNCGNTYYRPWDSDYSDYTSGGLYGPFGAYNLTGSYANSDWGHYNAISNGGNTSNTWRTLTRQEWDYIFNTRSTPSGIRYAKAKVNNVNGVILVPDNWSTNIYVLSCANQSEASFNSNVISASQWNILQNAGIVFLPAGGFRYGTSVSHVGEYGVYWSATNYGNYDAYVLFFVDSELSTSHLCPPRYAGESVRLVCPVY